MHYRNYFRGEFLIDYLEGKKIYLYGYGSSNEAFAKYLDRKVLPYIICDDESIKKIKFDNTSILVKSPGISTIKPIFQKIINTGVEIITDLELFYLLNSKKNFICVTGSNGKTTTCNVLFNLLGDLEFKMAGNMGIPLFSLDNSKIDNLIIEASSFMLECTKYFHPHIFIITNLFPHHLDAHGTFENYYQAKFKPIRNMRENDVIIYESSIKEIIPYLNDCRANKYSFSLDDHNADSFIDKDWIVIRKEKIFKFSKHRLINTGVMQDIIIGCIVAKLYKIDNEHIKEKLKIFNPLEHRFEIIHNSNSLIIINDSKATNPPATINALNNVRLNFPDYNIILILGGKDGNEDYHMLNQNLANVSQIYFYGENANIILNALDKEIKCKLEYYIYCNLDEVIHSIKYNLTKKVVILFSPASSSKDQFTSFEERGKVFKDLIIKKINLR